MACRNNVALALALLIGSHARTTWAASNLPSESTLQRDVRTYVTAVLGKSEPTLEVLYRLDSGASEIENELEIAECERTFGDVRNATTLSKECTNWIHSRGVSQTTSPSLYLREVRRRVALKPGSLAIQRIKSPSRNYDYFIVFATGTTPKGTLIHFEFGHLANPDLAPTPSSLVWLDKVNGVSISEQIQREVEHRK
jgi:hypothetical protein